MEYRGSLYSPKSTTGLVQAFPSARLVKAKQAKMRLSYPHVCRPTAIKSLIPRKDPRSSHCKKLLWVKIVYTVFVCIRVVIYARQ